MGAPTRPSAFFLIRSCPCAMLPRQRAQGRGSNDQAVFLISALKVGQKQTGSWRAAVAPSGLSTAFGKSVILGAYAAGFMLSPFRGKSLRVKSTLAALTQPRE